MCNKSMLDFDYDEKDAGFRSALNQISDELRKRGLELCSDPSGNYSVRSCGDDNSEEHF